MTSNSDINLSLKGYKVNDNSIRILSSIIPDEGTTRTPVNICCVVDISGSMSTTATFKNDKGQTESHGLTILDIVKHAVETIIHSLEPQDKLSIVAYSTKAHIVTNLTEMNDKGKKLSSDKLKTLKPTSTTNLWDGLHTGLEVLRKEHSDNQLSAVFILTDGMPNVEPPSGHIPMLRKYKDKNPMECTISSFGFGYSMDSPLLRDIAIEGDGMYAFIPDSGFVGTTFVNALSNILVTKAKQLKLDIEPPEGYSIKIPKNTSIPFISTSWGATISLSTLHFGQTRDFVFELEKKKQSSSSSSDTINENNPLTVTVKYQSCSKNTTSGSISKELTSINSSNHLNIEQTYIRQTFVDVIHDIIKVNSSSNLGVKEFIKQIQSSEFNSDEFISAIMEDANGQVLEALSKNEYYNKWGKHYLPSLARAHFLQQCNNFKDPGIQFYGGELFNEIRDKGDDIFVSLPPPKPSGNTSSYGSSSTSNYVPIASMTSYYCSSNPCFSGDSLVHMANNTLKQCKDIKKGDIVKAGNSYAEIICVIETLCENSKAPLVHFKDGLKITEYHPIRLNNTWYFPSDIKQAKIIPCYSVFSFVLDCEHTMIINNIECVTLGHSFTDNDVVSHPYFGSQRIINDLKQMNGWENGLIVFKPGCMRKDYKTDLVCTLDSSKVCSPPLIF